MGSFVRRSIGILGGTGAEGRGLGLRWCAAGHTVAIGSRDAARGRAAAERLADRLASHPGAVAPTGGGNREAAAAGDVVVVAAPYAAIADLLAEVAPEVRGKVVISVVVPLRPPDVATVHVPQGISAAVEVQRMLGASARVVAAFHNVAAGRLDDLTAHVGSDVLVCGDDADAKSVALRLVDDAGATGYDAGPLRNSVVPEGLTSVLIGINKRYGTRDAGVRIVNVPADRADEAVGRRM